MPKIRRKTLVGAQMYGLLLGGSFDYFDDSTPAPVIPSFISGVTVTYAVRTNTAYNGLSSIQNGDNIYIYHEIGGSTGSVPVPTTPAGFSLQAGYPLTRSDGGFSVQTYLYKKVASSESGNYTVTHSNTQSTGFAFCIRGGTLDKISTGNGAAPNSSISGFTVSAANSMVVYLIGGWDLVMELITPPSNLSFTLRNTPDDSLLWVGTASGVSGATGNFDSSNLPNAVWAATAFSLQPS